MTTSPSGPTRTRSPELPAPLLGEWACLGILYSTPAHGWAIARRLRPDGDIGRVWQLSRPLTYRSIDRLTHRGWISTVGEEPSDAGPNRTVLVATPGGRTRFRSWMSEPVAHLRDLRGEFLLKLVFADLHGIDVVSMLDEQRAIIDDHVAAIRSQAGTDDVVMLWRLEASHAAQRFVEQIQQRR